MLLSPFVSSSTSILFDAQTAMCNASGWNIIGAFTGYAAFLPLERESNHAGRAIRPIIHRQKCVRPASYRVRG